MRSCFRSRTWTGARILGPIEMRQQIDPKHPITARAVQAFCGLCGDAYVAWRLHKGVFNGNLRSTKCAEYLRRLSAITQEYALHQIVKLHDPAVQSGGINLTVDYIVDYGGWDRATQTALERIRTRLSRLPHSLKAARNKILSHNDLKTILSGAKMGAFAKGLDDKYFRDLQSLVDLAHDRAIGGPFPFDDLVNVDIREFLGVIRSRRMPISMYTAKNLAGKSRR